MDYKPIEDLLPKAGGSTYRLVRMAASRALELSEGKRCLVPNPASDKATSMALEEIANGKVVFKDSSDELDQTEIEVETVAEEQKEEV